MPLVIAPIVSQGVGSPSMTVAVADDNLSPMGHKDCLCWPLQLCVVVYRNSLCSLSSSKAVTYMLLLASMLKQFGC